MRWKSANWRGRNLWMRRSLLIVIRKVNFWSQKKNFCVNQKFPLDKRSYWEWNVEQYLRNRNFWVQYWHAFTGFLCCSEVQGILVISKVLKNDFFLCRYHINYEISRRQNCFPLSNLKIPLVHKTEKDNKILLKFK